MRYRCLECRCEWGPPSAIVSHGLCRPCLRVIDPGAEEEMDDDARRAADVGASSRPRPDGGADCVHLGVGGGGELAPLGRP